MLKYLDNEPRAVSIKGLVNDEGQKALSDKMGLGDVHNTLEISALPHSPQGHVINPSDLRTMPCGYDCNPEICNVTLAQEPYVVAASSQKVQLYVVYYIYLLFFLYFKGVIPFVLLKAFPK